MQEQNINSYINPDSGNTFKIDTRKLQAEFQCTVCLNPIQDCYVTRCGHVYCRACIEQTINRHHRCPFCNQALNEFKSDVFKNYHFNTIKKIVYEEKRSQAERYLNKVFAEEDEKENQQRDKLMGPIEKSITEMFKDCLLRYRDSLVNLYEMEKKAEERKIMLGSKHIRDNDQIITDIQNYILGNLPKPILSPEMLELPTHVVLELPGNKINNSIIKACPMATLETLLPHLQNICGENQIALKGKIEDELIINGEKKNIRERLGTLAGKKIQISGGLPFEVKVFCYTYNWVAGKACDFYMCQKCKIKWICESCILYCHEGHQSKIQLKAHKPEWAICYCATKCVCKALNKNS